MFIEGKLFVVLLVLALIFVGLIVFMIMTDQKLRKIERKMKTEDSTSTVTSKSATSSSAK